MNPHVFIYIQFNFLMSEYHLDTFSIKKEK